MLIESVNEDIIHHTTLQKDSAEAKKMAKGAHIKFLERKTEPSKKNNWMWHKSITDEMDLISSMLNATEERVSRAGGLATETIQNEAEETKTITEINKWCKHRAVNFMWPDICVVEVPNKRMERWWRKMFERSNDHVFQIVFFLRENYTSKNLNDLQT